VDQDESKFCWLVNKWAKLDWLTKWWICDGSSCNGSSYPLLQL